MIRIALRKIIFLPFGICNLRIEQSVMILITQLSHQIFCADLQLLLFQIRYLCLAKQIRLKPVQSEAGYRILPGAVVCLSDLKVIYDRIALLLNHFNDMVQNTVQRKILLMRRIIGLTVLKGDTVGKLVVCDRFSVPVVNIAAGAF